MAVYTFLESYDFSGKTIVPFCTHEGSGLSSMESSIADSCPNVEVLDGLAIRGSVAQNSQDEAKEAETYIFCHMMMSLDGEIMGQYMNTPEGSAAGNV